MASSYWCVDMPKMLRLTDSIANIYLSFCLSVKIHTFTHICLFSLTSPHALLSLTMSHTIQTLFQDQFYLPADIVIKLQTRSQDVARVADRNASQQTSN